MEQTEGNKAKKGGDLNSPLYCYYHKLSNDCN